MPSALARARLLTSGLRALFRVSETRLARARLFNLDSLSSTRAYSSPESARRPPSLGAQSGLGSGV
jgi:hypothetical protein